MAAGRLAAEPIEAGVYYQQLAKAFRRVIPREQKDQLPRLIAAIQEGPQGRTVVDQVLKDFRATGLKSYLQELDGVLNKRRLPLANAERRFSQGLASTSEVQAAVEQYSQDRLTVEELVVLIHFYQSRDGQANQLVKLRGVRRIDAETARLILGVTKFPFVQVREHGKGEPLIKMTEARQNEWRRVYKLFSDYGKAYEFAQLWAQMVNQNSGNKRFRHLETFEERFLWDLRAWAVRRGEVQKARDLLVSYLSNHASNTVLDRVGDNPRTWTRRQRADVKDTLAEVIVVLARTENRYQLRRLFSEGILPPHFPQQTESKQWSRALKIFRVASQSRDLSHCLKALSATAKYSD